MYGMRAQLRSYAVINLLPVTLKGADFLTTCERLASMKHSGVVLMMGSI